MWHVTHDMLHVTRGALHVVTRDTWHMTCLGGRTFSQNFSSLALTICDLWYYEDLEEKDDSINELINEEAVYRTAPATPGLLKICSALFCLWKSLFVDKIGLSTLRGPPGGRGPRVPISRGKQKLLI